MEAAYAIYRGTRAAAAEVRQVAVGVDLDVDE
jgi:hypothetical protein